MLSKPCTACDKKKRGCMCKLWSDWYAEQLELGFPDKPILNLKMTRKKFNTPLTKTPLAESQKDGGGLLIKGGKKYQRKEL